VLLVASHPKIRRNLEESSKGHSTEVRKQVCNLWVDLASKILVIRDNTKMCHSCFSDYDKYICLKVR